MNTPLATSPGDGHMLKYMYQKDTAIVVTRNPKKASKLRKLYISRKRKVNVSRPVMSTPTQMGMVLLERRLIAVADPITS